MKDCGLDPSDPPTYDDGSASDQLLRDEVARAAAFEAPWVQNIPSAPWAKIPKPAGGVPVLDQLHAVLVLYNQRLDDGYLPHLFFERLLQSIELFLPHCPVDMAHVLGDMMTCALNARDAYVKASRAVYFWCMALTSQLTVLQDLLKTGHLDDARTVLCSVYDGSVDAMSTALTALATTKEYLENVEDNVVTFSHRMRTGRLAPPLSATDDTTVSMSGASANDEATMETPETTTALSEWAPKKALQFGENFNKACTTFCNKVTRLLPSTQKRTTTCPPITIDITMADALRKLATRLQVMVTVIETGLLQLPTTGVAALVAKELQDPTDLTDHVQVYCEVVSALCNACNEFVENHKRHYDLATTTL